MTHNKQMIFDWLADRLSTNAIVICYSHHCGDIYELGIAPFGYDTECTLVVTVDQATDRITLDYLWTPATMNPRLTVAFWYLLVHNLALPRLENVVFDVAGDGILLLQTDDGISVVQDGFSITCGGYR